MEGIWQFVSGVIWYAVFVLLPAGAISVVMHFLLSLPVRRRDRALFFLDLLETVLQRGQSVEQAIISAAENHDRAPGVGFFLLAAHIEGGARLGEALEKVPGFLPPQVNAILRAGEKMGDLRRVLPACREALSGTPGTARTTMHYMVAVLLLFAPVCIWLISVLMVYVVPKCREVAYGLTDSGDIWPISNFVFAIVPQILLLEGVLFFSLLTVALAYIGGPRLVRWFQFRRVPIVDWLAWRMPWKRKKLLRTFSAMLAVLLDGGVPEAEAVRLAGEATANEICRRRAGRVIAALAGGTGLAGAVSAFDDNGEFHWRLTNASHARGGFLDSLRGWHEALDAKAFQQEETATHIVTSGLVVMNGLVVALVAIAMFGILIAILNGVLE